MTTVTIITENNPNPQVGQSVVLGNSVYTNFSDVSVDPNGTLAGAVDDKAFNTVNRVLYICTVSGTASTAVWTPINDAVMSGPYVVAQVL
ncbi:MAG: hypothetical protein ACYCOU_04240 [Sulfobacillus sp.]